MSIRDDRMSVSVPGRCSLADVVRMNTKDPANRNKGCIYCKHHTLRITSKQCFDCLATEHLDGFVLDPVLKEDKRYAWLKQEVSEWKN